MKRSDEIRTRMAAIGTDLKSIEDTEETDDNREELSLRFEALTEEFDTLDAELAPLAQREAKLSAVRTRMAEEANREPGASFGASLSVRTARDPYKDLDLSAVRFGALPASEVRARAFGAIEQHARSGLLTAERAEAATRLAERTDDPYLDSNGAVARHVLLTGTDEYRDEFRRYMRDPIGYGQRAALSLTPANGGYLVPYTLDPSIILTNNGSKNPWRSLATAKQTSTNDWNGVTSAGINAAWAAEGVEAADSSPTVGPLKITPQKAVAWVYGSFEVLEDSDFAAQFPTLMADAKDRLEEAGFATGTGVGQPKGLITAATTTITSTAGATTAFSAADIYALKQALPARWRGGTARNAWVASLAGILRGQQLPKFTGATTPLIGDDGNLLNDPVLESTSIAATLTTTGSKVLAYGDMSQFYIVDRIGMSVLYEPNVKGASGFPKAQAGWFAFWRTGSDVTTPNAFRVLVSS